MVCHCCSHIECACDRCHDDEDGVLIILLMDFYWISIQMKFREEIYDGEIVGGNFNDDPASAH